MCCLVVERPSVDLPEIVMELDGCTLSASVVTSCSKKVQSLVSSASYKHGAFFTEGTMESVRESIASSREFLASSAFDPWEGISCTDRIEFVTRHAVAFDDYLARKKKEAEEGLRDANRSPRHVRFTTASGSSATVSGDLQRTSLLPRSSFGSASPVACLRSAAVPVPQEVGRNRPVCFVESGEDILESRK